MITVRPMRESERDAVLDLIVGQQSDPARACTYVGTERDGVASELDDLGDWTAFTWASDHDGNLTGVVIADSDESLGRSWIHGPWVSGEWLRDARPLLDAALHALPPGVTRHEISADVAHSAMAALAAERGWAATEANHLYVTSNASAWPDEGARVRTARTSDAAAIESLHQAEFPDTYYSVSQLLDPERGFIVVVAENRGAFAGYAAGRVQADGSGYLDYVAVTDAARGLGLGRALVAAAGRRIAAAAPQHDLNLTVQESRTPACALYEALGMRRVASLVAYRHGF